jgi:hypothetical protein
LVRESLDFGWPFASILEVSAVGAPNVGERSEKDIVSAFVNRIAELAPQLVTFNGSSFDPPVLRYRAMVCGVAAPGLALRPYFNRLYGRRHRSVRRAVLPQNKTSLHELCRVMGLPQKPDGIDGADVEKYEVSRSRSRASASPPERQTLAWLALGRFQHRTSQRRRAAPARTAAPAPPPATPPHFRAPR